MKSKKVHLEIIRLIAISLVVLNHTDIYFLYFSATDNMITYLASLFISVLCRINVPLFFMVTGALLIPKEETVKQLYQRRIARMAAVIVIFSGVQYAALWFKNGLEGEYGLADFLKKLLTADIIIPYWFLYSYLAVLILLPFLRRMARGMGKNEFKYLIILKVVFDMILRILSMFMGYKIEIELFVLTENIFYVLLGYYLENRMEEDVFCKDGFRKNVLTGLIAVAGSTVLAVAGYIMEGEYSQDYFTVFTPIIAICVYFMVKSISIRYELPLKWQGVLLYIGSTVFGIYLIEQLVRRQLLPVYHYLCERTYGLVACAVYVMTTLLLSFIYVSILKKIPLIKELL